ncbi:MAG: DUF1800 domain-containing protein [Acidimicrobiales bacterium]
MAPNSIVTAADAAHLLRRAGFGGTPAEIDALTGRTRRSCVDALMGFTDSDPAPEGPDVGEPAFVTLSDQWKAQSQATNWWVARMANLPNRTVLPSAVGAVAAPSALQEKMVLFWHGHFACAQDKVGDFPVMWDQLRMFRRMGLGNFSALVKAVAVHPAMLVYLDNETNVAGLVQENFARELMELYTCGVGHYSEDDVVAMARAWTGHNTVGWNGSFRDTSYVYRPEMHDHGDKRLFGVTANWNGIAQNAGERDTVDELVDGSRRTATARHIARKLFRFLVHDRPSDAVVSDLAGAFVASDMQVAALLRAVLLHDEFWRSTTRHALPKSPAEYVASVVKRTGIPAATMGLRWRMIPMGQVLFDPPGVEGWGGGDTWISTSSLWARGSLMNQVVRWEAADRGLLSDIASLTPAQATQAILDLFGLETVSASTRREMERWHRRATEMGTWPMPMQGFLLGVLSPEFQVQ